MMNQYVKFALMMSPSLLCMKECLNLACIEKLEK